MKNMVVVCAFLVVAACGKKDADKAAGGASSDPAVKLMADYAATKDKLCACPDKECTTKFKAEADALEKGARATLPNPTPEQKTAFKGLEKQVNECARKY